MTRVLLLLHEREDPAGFVGTILEEHHISTDVVEVEREPIPDPTTYAAVIAFGGVQHVYRDDLYPYFVQEKALLLHMVEQDIPYLGLCLGGQLLASALGAVVKQHTAIEFGFHDIFLNETGKEDPLYAGLPGYQRVFQWHEDTFELPTNAALLASNEHTRNQAFRYGPRAYGLQYHIEVDPPMLNSWLEYVEHDAEAMQALGVETFAALKSESAEHFPLYYAHGRILVENFLRISRLL
jgi:GMP synthase-like glutamine amidotransferase